jgi:autotransporter adhesin
MKSGRPSGGLPLHPRTALVLPLAAHRRRHGRKRHRQRLHNTAVGVRSTASGANSTAVGPNAQATGANAAAIGAGSVASEANTVSVGSAARRRRADTGTATPGTIAVPDYFAGCSRNENTTQATATSPNAAAPKNEAMPNWSNSQPKPSSATNVVACCVTKAKP